MEKIRNAFNYGLLDGNTSDYSNFLNRKNGDLGETLLHYYARSDNDQNDKIVYDLLLTNGADINCIDSSIDLLLPVNLVLLNCYYVIVLC